MNRVVIHTIPTMIFQRRHCPSECPRETKFLTTHFKNCFQTAEFRSPQQHRSTHEILDLTRSDQSSPLLLTVRVRHNPEHLIRATLSARIRTSQSLFAGIHAGSSIPKAWIQRLDPRPIDPIFLIVCPDDLRTSMGRHAHSFVVVNDFDDFALGKHECHVEAIFFKSQRDIIHRCSFMEAKLNGIRRSQHRL